MNTEVSVANEPNKVIQGPKYKIIAILFSRMLLFAVFQAAIAVIFNSWYESEKYWMLVATLGNLVSIYLLTILFRREGKKYLNIFCFDKANWKKDLTLFLFLFLLLIPLALVPNHFLSILFWGDPAVPYKLLFQPVHNFVSYFLLAAFPLTIALAELPTYFGYIMPGLGNEVRRKWIAIFLPVIFLSVQHVCLPLVFDYKFILYRGLMYFPFALTIGISLWKRPRLLPFFVILHGLMDMQAVIMLIIETNK